MDTMDGKSCDITQEKLKAALGEDGEFRNERYVLN